MQNEVKEKLMYEYELFYLDCMRQSKAGIFARSGEIGLKRDITMLLRKMIPLDETACEKLAATDNILESLYRFVVDHKETKVSLEDCTKKWLDLVESGQNS